MYHKEPGAISYNTLLFALRIISILGTIFILFVVISQYYRHGMIPPDVDAMLGVAIIFTPAAIVPIALLLFQDYKLDLAQWKTRQSKLQAAADQSRIYFASTTDRSDVTHTGVPFMTKQHYWIAEMAKFTSEISSFEIGTIVYGMRETIGQSELIGYIAIDLERNVPQILLDSKHNNRFGSNLLQIPKGNQIVTLEGDFDRYFTAYAPHGYDTDIRYILTPDAMALLIDAAAGYDIEFVGSKLYIYKNGGIDLLDDDEYELCQRLVDSIGAKSKIRTRRYQHPDTIANPESQRLRQTRRIFLFNVFLLSPLPFTAAIAFYMAVSLMSA